MTAQEPLQTVGDLGALDADALPDVWVPDSSLWAARAADAALEAAGSMASSPVVLATSRAAADALGWTDAARRAGRQALATGRPLAVPDLAASAEGLAALAAVRSSLGGGEDADNAVVAGRPRRRRGRRRSRRPTRWPPAPPVARTPRWCRSASRRCSRTNQDADDPALVAVYPSEGSPYLDYPVLRVGERSGDARAASTPSSGR